MLGKGCVSPGRGSTRGLGALLPAHIVYGAFLSPRRGSERTACLGGGAPFQEGTGRTGLLIFAGDGMLAVCPWGPWEILIDVFNIRKLRHRTSRGLKKTCSSISGQELGLGSKWPGSRGVFDSLPPDPRETKGIKTLIMLVPFVPHKGGKSSTPRVMCTWHHSPPRQILCSF